MSGIDTFFGTTFQTAFCVLVALELVEEGPKGSILRVEGVEDIVDYEVRSAIGARLRVGQAKTRREPRQWNLADLAPIFSSWGELDDADAAAFEFVTDGQLGREATRMLVTAVADARAGSLSRERRDDLAGRGFVLPDSLLARVRIRTGESDPATLLELASSRLRQLIEWIRPATQEEARSKVERLYTELDLAAGRRDLDQRGFTRDDLAELAGISTELLDLGSRWNADLAVQYRTSLSREAIQFAKLEVQAIAASGPALRLTVAADDPDALGPQPCTSLLGRSRAVVVGETGAGKSALLAYLSGHAAGAGRLPVRLIAERAVSDLRRLVHATLERALGRRLSPGAGDLALATPGAILMLDGLSELPPDSRDRLITELQDLLDANPGLSCLITGRDVTLLRLDGFSPFRVLGLDGDLRRELAALRVPAEIDAGLLVSQMEKALNDAVDNPLLFLMAINLWVDGVRPDSPARLYEGFLAGIAERERRPDLWSSAGLALAGVCVELIAAERFSLDHTTWLRALVGRLTQLTDRRFVSPEESADALLGRFLEAGMLARDELTGQIGLLHDSFRDHLASRWFSIAPDELPQSLDRRWEESIDRLAEIDGLTAKLREGSTANLVVAARLAVHDRRYRRNEALPIESHSLLRDLLRRYLLVDHDLGLLICRHRDNLAVLLVPGVRSRWIDSPELRELAGDAEFMFTMPTDSGPLALAVRAVLASLRRRVRARARDRPVAIPTDRAGIAATLERGFRAQLAAVNETLHVFDPDLRERVLEQIGWRGLQGVVLPPVERPWEDGAHPFPRSYATSLVRVVVGETADESWEESGTAEDFLRESPAEKARGAVDRALAVLLPGYER